MSKDQEPPIQTLSVQNVYDNPWLHIEEHTVKNSDGSPGVYGVLDYGDGVTVLPITDDGKISLIREYKYAVGEHMLQLPSGTIEPDEEPEAAARRELLEETGYEADDLLPLGTTHPFPTSVRTTVHLFAAEHVRLVDKPEEGIEIFSYSKDKIRQMIKANEITHSGTVICLLKYLHKDDE